MFKDIPKVTLKIMETNYTLFNDYIKKPITVIKNGKKKDYFGDQNLSR